MALSAPFVLREETSPKSVTAESSRRGRGGDGKGGGADDARPPDTGETDMPKEEEEEEEREEDGRARARAGWKADEEAMTRERSFIEGGGEGVGYRGNLSRRPWVAKSMPKIVAYALAFSIISPPSRS